MPNKSIHSLTEKQLIQKILREEIFLFHFFNFVVEPALGYPRAEWDYWCLHSVPRELLGLPHGERPGDIDALIVPCRGGKPYCDLMAAVEVKVLQLPVAKRHKDTASSGIGQANGLLRDGFPFVGILHIVIPEPSPKDQWKRMRMARVIDASTQAVEMIPGDHPFDPINTTGPDRQYGRLRKHLEQTCIGYSSVSLAISADGICIKGVTLARNRMAKRNPNTRSEIFEDVEKFIDSVCQY